MFLKMKRFVYRNRYFFIPYLAFVFISALVLLFFNKTQIHIELNKLNSPFFDQFFKRITFLGDGFVYVLILAVLLLYNYRWTVIFAVSIVISNLAVFIGKQMIFYETYRPSKYFELYEKYELHLVEGVNLHNLQSFPSGHTTSAFTIFIMLAFLVRNNYLKLFCFIVALLTGYSRIYLSQHFLVDVLAGSVIGVASVLVTWHSLEGYNTEWFDYSLVSSLKKRNKKDIPATVAEGALFE